MRVGRTHDTLKDGTPFRLRWRQVLAVDEDSFGGAPAHEGCGQRIRHCKGACHMWCAGNMSEEDMHDEESTIYSS
jgi:hypothetical protein